MTYKKNKIVVLVTLLLIFICTLVLGVGVTYAAAEKGAVEDITVYTLTVNGGTVQMFIPSEADETQGEWQVLTPDSTTGEGKTVRNVYNSVKVGAKLKATAVANTADDSKFFVAWDYRYINGRVGEMGNIEYEFEMPQEDIELWAQYTTGADINLNANTDNRSVNAINKRNPDKSDYTGMNFVNSQITNGKAAGSDTADSDLLGLNGKQFQIPSNTANYRHIRVKGTNISTKAGTQAVFYVLKNHSDKWTITVRLFLESYGAVPSDPGQIVLKPGEVKYVTATCTLGFDRGYMMFAVDKIEGEGDKTASDIINVDVVGLFGSAYPASGDPLITPPKSGQMIKVDSPAMKNMQYDKNSGVFSVATSNGDTKANGKITRSLTYYPTSADFTVYGKFTSLIDKPNNKTTVYISTDSNGTNRLGSIDLTENEGTQIFHFDVKGWDTTSELYFGCCNNGGENTRNYVLQAAFNSAFENEVEGIGAQNGYVITPVESQANPVPYGESYSFTLNINESHNKSKNYVVKANQKIIRPVDGIYTIYNITEKQTITVEGITINQYVMSGLSGLGYNIEIVGSTTNVVGHGNAFKFKVNVNNDFDSSQMKVYYQSGSGEKTLLTVDGGVYTIPTVTADTEIIVEGVKMADALIVSGLKGVGYNAVSQTTGVTIADDGKALLKGADAELSFKIELSAGYEAKGGLTVKVNGVELSSQNGVYTISASSGTNEATVTVEGITEIGYTINYNLGTATLADPNAAVTFTVTTPDIVLCEAVKAGYTFLGWYTEENGGGTAVNVISQGTVGNITIYPHFEAIKYELTLQLNGGEWVQDYTPPTEFTAEGLTLPTAENLTKTGYTFTGWLNNKNEKVTEIAPGIVANIVLTAEWTTVQYTVTFELNGGSWTEGFTADTEYTVESGLSLPTADNIVRKGYQFSGWSANENLSGTVIGISQGLTGNRTLYAKWTKIQYSITYSGLEDAIYENKVETYDIETPEFTVAAPLKVGYEFTGWTYGDVQEPIKELKIKGEDICDYTLTANWELATYTITYVGVEEGHSYPTTYQLSDKDITIGSPEMDGFVFEGWVSPFSNVPVKEFVILAGTAMDIELTAKWKKTEQEDLNIPVVYAVTFATNGGSAVEKQYITEGDKAVKPVDPVWEGATFAGWFKDAACTQEFDFNSAVESDVTVYAKWITKGSAGGCNGNITTTAVTLSVALVGVAVVMLTVAKKSKES